MLEKLIKIPKKLILLIFSFVALINSLVLYILIFNALPSEPFGIIDYEFAWSIENVQDIFSTWGAQGIEAHIAGVWWDFFFLINYSIFLAGIILLVTRMNTGKIQTIGLYMSVTPFIAGCADAIENIFLLIMLKNPTTLKSSFSIIVTISATMKFGLLIIGLLFFVIALITGILTKLRRK